MKSTTLFTFYKTSHSTHFIFKTKPTRVGLITANQPSRLPTSLNKSSNFIKLNLFTKTKLTNNASLNFGSRQLLEDHFQKHSKEFQNNYHTADEYLEGAREVIKQGTKVSYQYKNKTCIGYVRFMGNTRSGDVKFEFVGTDEDIKTYYVGCGKTFWKLMNGNSSDKIIMPHDYKLLSKTFNLRR